MSSLLPRGNGTGGGSGAAGGSGLGGGFPFQPTLTPPFTGGAAGSGGAAAAGPAGDVRGSLRDLTNLPPHTSGGIAGGSGSSGGGKSGPTGKPFQRITAGPLYETLDHRTANERAAIVHKLQTEPRDKATAARAAGGDALTAGLTHLEHLVNSALGADSQDQFFTSKKLTEAAAAVKAAVDGGHPMFMNVGSYASLHEAPWSLHTNAYMQEKLMEAALPTLMFNLVFKRVEKGAGGSEHTGRTWIDLSKHRWFFNEVLAGTVAVIFASEPRLDGIAMRGWGWEVNASFNRAGSTTTAVEPLISSRDGDSMAPGLVAAARHAGKLVLCIQGFHPETFEGALGAVPAADMHAACARRGWGQLGSAYALAAAGAAGVPAAPACGPGATASRSLSYRHSDFDTMAMLVLHDTCAALAPSVRIPLNPSLLTESGAVRDPAGMQTCLMAQAFDASVPSHEKWSQKRNGKRAAAAGGRKLRAEAPEVAGQLEGAARRRAKEAGTEYGAVEEHQLDMQMGGQRATAAGGRNFLAEQPEVAGLALNDLEQEAEYAGRSLTQMEMQLALETLGGIRASRLRHGTYELREPVHLEYTPPNAGQYCRCGAYAPAACGSCTDCCDGTDCTVLSHLLRRMSAALAAMQQQTQAITTQLRMMLPAKRQREQSAQLDMQQQAAQLATHLQEAQLAAQQLAAAQGPLPKAETMKGPCELCGAKETSEWRRIPAGVEQAAGAMACKGCCVYVTAVAASTPDKLDEAVAHCRAGRPSTHSSPMKGPCELCGAKETSGWCRIPASVEQAAGAMACKACYNRLAKCVGGAPDTLDAALAACRAGCINHDDDDDMGDSSKPPPQAEPQAGQQAKPAKRPHHAAAAPPEAHAAAEAAVEQQAAPAKRPRRAAAAGVARAVAAVRQQRQ